MFGAKWNHQTTDKASWQGIFWILLVCLPVAVAGCRSPDSEVITSQLWRDRGLDSHFAPADDANLQLFEDGDGKDVLVVYNEAQDDKNVIRRRAYFVRQDGDRIDGGSEQHFVSPELASKMQPIPVEMSKTNRLQTEWARLSADGRYFTLFSGEKSLDTFDPPSYAKRNNLKRLLLTPLAVVADMSMPTPDSFSKDVDALADKMHNNEASSSSFDRHTH